jgi:uncharacterized protein (DUF1684 family)
VRRRAVLVLLAAACGPGCGPGGGVDDPDAYAASIAKKRSAREQRLRADDGWLTLVGLHWLEPGENGFGRAPDNAIVLEGGPLPDHAGRLLYDGRTVRLVAPATSGITIDGEPFEGERELRVDPSPSPPNVVSVGRLRFHVMERGGRHAVRVRDPQSPALASFSGLEYFPIDPAWRVEARYRAYPEPRPIAVPNVLGSDFQMIVPGEVSFELRGEPVTLLPLLDKPDDKELFFIVKDGTSGQESYGACRYLYSELGPDDTVTLDFNLLYNPPCAFTPYATCPLPPPENRLAVRIEAGEKAPAHL